MGAEVQADVSDYYRQGRSDLERKINERIEAQDYGSGLAKWYFVAIIRAIDDAQYGEVAKYVKSKKEAEFRKKIDFNKFKAADSFGRRKLVIDALVETVHLMSTLGIPNFDCHRLLEDVVQVVQNEGWLHRTA